MQEKLNKIFFDDKWYDKMDEVFNAFLEEGDPSSVMEKSDCLKEVKMEVANLMKEEGITCFKVDLINACDTCDGGCLEAMIAVAYVDKDGAIQIGKINLASNY